MSIALIPILTFGASQIGTPGPANMVMLAAGARFGLRKSLPFVAGVALGKQFIIWPLGFGVLALQDDFPLVFTVLKWVSVAYILFLAYRVAGMRMGANGAAGDAPPGFAAGLIVHPLNPKAWAMLTTTFTTFVNTNVPPLQATATVAICFLALQAVLHPIWAYAGQRIAVLLAGRPGERYLMWALAALTVASVVYALFGGAKP